MLYLCLIDHIGTSEAQSRLIDEADQASEMGGPTSGSSVSPMPPRVSIQYCSSVDASSVIGCAAGMKNPGVQPDPLQQSPSVAACCMQEVSAHWWCPTMDSISKWVLWTLAGCAAADACTDAAGNNSRPNAMRPEITSLDLTANRAATGAPAMDQRKGRDMDTRR
jgi:hypothetical protein